MISKHELPIGERRMRFPTRQFLVLFLPVAAVILATGFSFIELRSRAQMEGIAARELAQLHLLSGFIGAEVFSASNHLSSLAREAAVRQAIDAPHPANLRALASEMLILARRNPTYQQVRWIDETGRERIRAMRDRGAPYSVAQADLQDKSKRYYFVAANNMLAGEIYVSKIDLNVEQGEIETPLRPVLRVAIGVEDSRGERRGILIVNIDVKYLLGVVEDIENSVPDAEYWLLNGEGQILTALDSAFGMPSHPGYASSFPQLKPIAWSHISSGRSGSIEVDNEFWVWETLSPADVVGNLARALEGDSSSPLRVISDNSWLTLVSYKPISTLINERRETRLPVILGAILLLAAYAWSLVFYLRSQMAEKRAELNIAHAMAHAQNMERLKELEQRFRLLVEASTVGLLLVDPDGAIVMSNPAADAMFGYAKGDLEGSSVESLLPTGMREGHARLRAEFLKHPEVRKMGGQRELKALRKDGREFPVEVGLNPCLDHGKQFVLATVIDTSERKASARTASAR